MSADIDQTIKPKNFLAEYDAAPTDQKYPLVKGWIKSEPLAFFKQLREERPVLQTPECTLVANFVDVRDMLQMPRIFTVDLYKPKMGVTSPEDGYLMAHDETPLHYREKSLMQGLLNRNDLPQVRQMIAETAERVLKEANGDIDLVNEFSRMVPVHLVQDYFGLDGVDKEDLIRWSYWNQYDAFNNQPFDMLSDKEHALIVQKHDEASEELVAYITVLMFRKLIAVYAMKPVNFIYNPLRKLVYSLLGKTPPRRPANMVKRMVAARFSSDTDFPLTRVGINAGGLLIGAIETTSQAVVQVVDYFLEHPALLKKAKDNAYLTNTAAFDAMVWEALRFVPIRPDIFRKAASDYTIAKGTEFETEIKKDTIVRLLIHSAMFDPYAYDHPDEFDPDRSPYHNFVFGHGQHECLGKYVGIEMIPEMVRQVVLRNDLKSQGKISFINPLFPDREGPFPESYKVSWS